VIVHPGALRALTAALGVLALAPGRAEALSLLEPQLSVERAPAPSLRVALADEKSPGPPLDFDLLGEPPKAKIPQEDPSLRRRRQMLTLHQGLGIALYATQLTTTVVGQLNYNDKFGIDNTGKYTQPHMVLAYTNIGAFALTGVVALLAPRAKGAKSEGFDRVTVHRISMAVATAGMLAQGFLGWKTAQREGYLDKPDYGRTHLVVGYATLAAMTVGIGALVF
jgi:hypothetical protein